VKLLEKLKARRQRKLCAKQGHDLERFSRPGRGGWEYVETCTRCPHEEAVPLSRGSRRRLSRERGEFGKLFQDARRLRRPIWRGIYTTRQAADAEARIARQVTAAKAELARIQGERS
jgi:hypothetical protein